VSALRQQARLARYVASRRIDIVHAYSFYGNVFAIPPARIAGVPVVIASIRDRAPYLTPMQKRAQRWACQFADCILANAVAVKDWLIDDGSDASEIVVIPNGVDLTGFERIDRAESLFRALGVPDGTGRGGRILAQPLKGLSRFRGGCARCRLSVGAVCHRWRHQLNERPYWFVHQSDWKLGSSERHICRTSP
jgi:glycosyltransferase involved in cell wall biosynthesis